MRFVDWGARVQPDDLRGDLTWHSAGMKRDFTLPRAICIVQIFNHQTHHRGQVHAMLTAADAKPDDTDLVLMKDL